jgi:hypothetical protein
VLTGEHFRLRVETLGLEISNDDNRSPVQVPVGQIITVLSGPRPDDKRLVEVQWGGKKLVMFVEDIRTRAEQVTVAS